MRWCAALALVLVALVVVTVRGVRRNKRHAPPVDPEVAELAAPAPAEPRVETPAVDLEREPTGIAHLRGRVLFPAGVQPTRELVVAAEDFTRELRARTSRDGHFEIHLPSGRYTLVASQGPLVGVVPDILLRSGALPDLDIRLGAGATIRGTLLRTPDDNVEVTALPVGRSDESGHGELEDDIFTVAGLIPGRRYDVTFSGPDVRTLKLAGVTAPSDGLEVELQARAKVRGAIGFPSGESCPISYVALQIPGKTAADDDADEVSSTMGADCGFELTAPDQAAAVRVVATGDGWHLEQEVAIPSTGDPAPICLNPPCRDDPTEGLARLQLTADGAPTEMSGHAWGELGARRRHRDCSGTAGACAIEDLPPGTTISAVVRGTNCKSDTAKITLAAGDNHVRLTCHAHRQIEGVVRVPSTTEQDHVSVRCAGDDGWSPVLGTRLFQLTCRADVAAVEYQIGAEGAWRRVPVAPAGDPAFVDIGPL